MPEKIADEKRREIIGRMFLLRNAAKVAEELDVGETTVRNVMKEVEAGVYPDYTPYVLSIDAISRLNKELTATGVSVGQAGVGLTIFTALREMDIDPKELLNILKTLRQVAGDTPSAEFGRAIQQLSKLQVETGLSFSDLESLVVAKRSECENLLAQLRDIIEKVNSYQVKETETRETLERTLRQNGVTEQFLERYTTDKRALADAGFTIGDLKTLADFIRAARAGGFLETSRELERLEAETGMSFETLLKEYQRTRTTTESCRQEEKRLYNVIHELRSKVVDLKREEAEQLAQNGITKEKLDRHLAIVDRLTKAGIDMGKLERLIQLLDNVEKLGYDPDRTAQYLSKTADVNDETKKAKSHLAEIKHQCNQETERFTQLQQRLSTAAANLDNITQTAIKAQLDLNDVLRRAKDKSHLIEFAEAIRLLFTDLSRIHPTLLLELAAMLKMIVDAKLNPAAIYPIDYESTREKAVALLELAIGKSLVTRDKFDDLHKRLGEKHDDLMLHELTKMGNERNTLAKEKADVSALTNAVEQASRKKILEVAVSAQANGFVRLYNCLQCGRPLAAALAGTKCVVSGCPSCGYDTSPQQ